VRGLYDAKGYYRVRHPDHLVEELEIAKKKYPFRIVRFYDDIFPYEIPWLKEFSALYRARVALPFICYLHPGLVNEERIGFLKEAGCSEIRIGVQTLNSEIRKNVLARSETNLSIEKAIDSVKRYGIKVVTENILGLPCEKDADVIQMMDFYNRNRPHRNHFFWLRYYPGLEITTRRSEWSAVPANFSDGQVFTQGGDTYKIANRQLIAALHLLPFLPEKVMEYFIDHKFWKFIPAWSPLWFLNLIANMTSGSDSDRIWRDRTAKRYLSSLMGSS
jgi:radical SAM superfamily enzyme YgiQ (UPF0313 family)